MSWRKDTHCGCAYRRGYRSRWWHSRLKEPQTSKPRYCWVTIAPLTFVATTTLVAGWQSITDIFWPLAQRPETMVQGYINTFLTATIMTAAVVILADSIRRWLGMGKRPESLVQLAEAESAL